MFVRFAPVEFVAILPKLDDHAGATNEMDAMQKEDDFACQHALVAQRPGVCRVARCRLEAVGESED